MKLKKILLAIAIMAILSVTFVLAVSASEYDFISSNYANAVNDYYLGVQVIKFQPYLNDEDLFVAIPVAYDGPGNYYIRPCDFHHFVEWVNGSINYSSFVEFCGDVPEMFPHLSDDTLSFFHKWSSQVDGFGEAYFNKLCYYTEITQEDLDAKDERIANLTNTLETLDKSFYEQQGEYNKLQTEFDELSEQNTQLQSDVDNLTLENESLEVQVGDLIKAKTEINSELMALDAKLEREVSKAYLQGYDDATGFDWTPIVVGLSAVSMLLTIISLCVRGKKKKR